MTGVLLGAKFSYGCQRANELGLTPLLKEYAFSEGFSHPEETIRAALRQLVSYFFYRPIALANSFDDPFGLMVVKAHWIGSELLEKVKLVHLKQALEEEKWDPVVFAWAMESVIKGGKLLHHNSYARYKDCFMTTDINGKYLYHLGEPRISATAEDFKNLTKYGKK